MTIASRHLVLLLLLQVHGLGDSGPRLSLVPRQAASRTPDSAVVPIAFRYHQEALAKIDLPLKSVALSPVVPTPPAGPSPQAPERPRAVPEAPPLIYLFMCLTR